MRLAYKARYAFEFVIKSLFLYEASVLEGTGNGNPLAYGHHVVQGLGELHDTKPIN